MAFPLERWAKQAVKRERKGVTTMAESGPALSWPGKDEGNFTWPFEPVASKQVLGDISELMQMHRATWKERQRQINALGVPQMAEGTYGALMNYPPAATITTTSTSGTANLWPGGVYTSIPANGVLTPQAYRIVVAAKITTVATPANIGFDPRIGQGTWTTGGTAITGVTLGASGNVALTASITNAFYYIYGDMTIRSLGAPGTNATAVGMFHYVSTQATASGLAGPAVVGAGHNLLFGGTNASYDWSLAQGFQLGAVHTVTTITHNVEQIHGMDWN